MHTLTEKPVILLRNIDIYVLILICLMFAYSNVTFLVIGLQAIFVGITIVNIIHTKKIKITVHFLWLFLFMLWALFITLFSNDAMISTKDLLNLFAKFLFFTCLIIYLDRDKRIEFLMKSIVIGGLLLSLRIIITTPISTWGSARLGEEVGLNPNTIGISMAFASLISVFIAKSTTNKKYYIFTLLFITIGVFTGSRKAILAIIGGLSLLFFLMIKKKKNLLLSIILIFITSFGLLKVMFKNPFLYEVIGRRIESLGFIFNETQADASITTRSTMINEGWELFVDNPIIGYGLENYRLLSVFETYSHNNYIELLVSTGFIGTLIYYSFPVILLMLSILKFIKTRNKGYSLIIVLLITILMMDFALVSYKSLKTHLIILLCIVYYIALKKNLIDSKGIINLKQKLVRTE